MSGVESASVRISRPPGCVQSATGREYVIRSQIGDRTLVAESVGDGLLMLWRSDRGSSLASLPVGPTEVSSNYTGLGTFASERSEVGLLWAPSHI